MLNFAFKKVALRSSADVRSTANPQLRARTFSLSFKKPFQILADADLVSLRDTPFLSETVLRQKLLPDLDSNQD